MRVLVVTHYYPKHGGGIEIVAGELARRLVDRGVEVVWAASEEQAHGAPEGVTRWPVSAWNVTEKKLGFPYPLWSPVSLAGLEQLVRDCDVVHLHDSLYLGNVVAYLWARRHGKPVVVTQHVGPIPYKSPVLRGMLGLANRTLARLVLSGSEQAVFISPRVEGYFRELFRFKNAPLYLANGVDTERFTPATAAERLALRSRFGWPRDRKVRLFVGRWVEKKGLPFLREPRRRGRRICGCSSATAPMIRRAGASRTWCRSASCRRPRLSTTTAPPIRSCCRRSAKAFRSSCRKRWRAACRR